MSNSVTEWLEQLGLGHYAEAFTENAIDEHILSDLTDADLKELGVTALGHRKTFPLPSLTGGPRFRFDFTVAYFTMREAVKGSEEHSVEWLGAVWHFSTAEHQEMFASSPVQYSPQYGGYCADGVAYGQSTANINPTAWRIVDGKLYLNFSKGAAEELEQTSGQIEKADQNWKDRIHTKVKSQ